MSAAFRLAGSARAALAAAPWLVACVHPPPAYVPLDVPLAPLPAERADAVRDEVAYELLSGRIPSLAWSPSAAVPPRLLSADALDEVPPEALWVVLLCETPRMRGTEMDLVLALDGTPATLSVWVEPDGATRLWRGAAPPESVDDGEPRVRAQAIATRYGLGGVEDGERPWSYAELDALEQALALLGPDERAVLRGVVMRRDAASPRSSRELALYDPVGPEPVIHVYDGAFTNVAWSFVGDPSSPTAASVMTLVHEFGHVLSDAPLDVLWDLYQDARQSRFSASAADRPGARKLEQVARRQVRQAGARGPVIDAWDALRPGRGWPTSWSTDRWESFAEGFALYKTDPEALRRVAPEALAWFQEGGHLAWRADRN